ncbi:MAG: RNA pseudouridine synthase, partial [Micrococcales bacterium]
MTSRMLPVTPGLAGERADAGLAKLLGLSRSAAAEMLAGGLVLQNGKLIGKSDRLIEDAWLDVTLP